MTLAGICITMNEKRKNPAINQKSEDANNSLPLSESIDKTEANQQHLLREAFQHYIPRKYLPIQNDILLPSSETTIENVPLDYREEPLLDQQETKDSEHLKKYNPAQITEIISSSTATIKKLVEVNEGLKLHIFETISSLEAQLEKEKSYSAQIRRELENTRIEYHKDTQKNAARIKELEQMISALNERLKQTMGQIDNAVKWFDNIKGQINSDLLEAMDRAKRILK